jgi:hypothetical protein
MPQGKCRMRQKYYNVYLKEINPFYDYANTKKVKTEEPS